MGYDWHWQWQPSAQLSQQLLSQLQSGQPSQQLFAQQLPEHWVAAGVLPAKARPLVKSAPTVARENNVLVNMMKLTFWLMALIYQNWWECSTNISRASRATRLDETALEHPSDAARRALALQSDQPAAVENAMGNRNGRSGLVGRRLCGEFDAAVKASGAGRQETD